MAPCPERPFRAFALDRPTLSPLLDRLRADERLPALASSLPTRVRVAEPVLALVLAALHAELGRGLSVLVPEDTDARDLAEAIAWFAGEDQVNVGPLPRSLAGQGVVSIVLAAGGQTANTVNINIQ